MQDNRNSPRYKKHLRAVLIIEESGKRSSIKGTTQDISRDGTSFISEYNIVSSNIVTIYLMLDPGDATHAPKVFEAQGNIVSSVLSPQQGGFRLGIQYTKISADNKQVLQKFMAPIMAHARGMAHHP